MGALVFMGARARALKHRDLFAAHDAKTRADLPSIHGADHVEVLDEQLVARRGGGPPPFALVDGPLPPVREWRTV